MSIKLSEKREQEIREALEKSTKVVAWHAHPKEVRGPYYRWFTCTGGDIGMLDGVKYQVASIEDDVRYASIAMNSVPELLGEIDILRSRIKNLKEAMSLTIDRADDYADSYITSPVRTAFSEDKGE